jgi:hypothetical protein
MLLLLLDGFYCELINARLLSLNELANALIESFYPTILAIDTMFKFGKSVAA